MTDWLRLDIQTPPEGHPHRRTWVLWAALEYLKQCEARGARFVPAHEFRQFVEQYVISVNVRNDVLRDLARVGAIGKVNRSGSTAKRYFVTEVGHALAVVYRNVLEGKSNA